MLGRLTAAFTLLLLGCTRDTTLPDPPGPGALTGRVLLARPGESEKRPLSGVEVRLLGNGQATTTSPAGTFTLADVEVTSGLLLFRVEVDGALRQRVLQLADFGTGPARQVNLGDLVLGANATVRGNALRGDLATRGGHGGTTLFVPAGPFTAFTNDDGSYVIEQMPEGPVELFAFRTGYAPQALGGISLRSGELLTLHDVVLELATSTAPGAVSGSLRFIPEAAGPGDTRVRLVSSEGASVDAVVGADDTFTAASVPVGLYRLSATRTGYSQLEVINLLVASGLEAKVGTLTLTTAPPFDAGLPPTWDASVPFDAGTGDAGTNPDGGTLCSLQADCEVGQWCDPKFARCVPLCAIDFECGFGRVCDQPTRTCVNSCAGTCPAGQTCSAQNVCEAVCSGAFPCPSGKRCQLNRCVNECDPAVADSCTSPFLTCDLGACRRNTFCTEDLDCTREQLCVGGQCGARPTDAGVQSDGGRWLDGGLLFSCANPCECRVGEQCADGFCVSDLVPTRFVTLDGGGGGQTPNTPSGLLFVGVPGIVNVRASEDGGQGGIVALRREDTWSIGQRTLRVLDGTHLAGGFTDCQDGRWLRDRSHRTPIAGEGASSTFYPGLFLMEATTTAAFSSGSLSGLSLSLTGTNTCSGAALTVRAVSPGLRVDGLTLRDLDATLALGACGATTAMLRATAMRNGRVERVRLDGLSGLTGMGALGLSFVSSSATVEDVHLGPVSVSGTAIGLEVVTAPEPFVLRRFFVDRWTGGDPSMRGVRVAGPNAAITLEDVSARFFASTTAGLYAFTGVHVSNTGDLTMRRVSIDGAGHPGPVPNLTRGVELQSSLGTVSDLTVRLPSNTTAVAEMAGLVVGTQAGYDISNLEVSGQGLVTTNPTRGLWFNAVAGGAPTVVRNANLKLSGNRVVGVHTGNSGSGAELAVTDSRIEVRGEGGCNLDVRGVWLDNPGTTTPARLRVERVEILASNSALALGAFLEDTSQLELFASTIRTPGSYGQNGICQGSLNQGGTIGVMLTDASRLKALSSTIDSAGLQGQPGQSSSIFCNTNTTQVTSLDSSVLTAGTGTPSRFIAGQASVAIPLCTQPPNARSNYFFRAPSASTVPDSAEGLFDGGMLGGNANTFGTTNCFAPSVALADGGSSNPLVPNGAPCLNGGVITQRTDGTPIVLDLFGRVRDAGGAPDIGAIEAP